MSNGCWKWAFKSLWRYYINTPALFLMNVVSIYDFLLDIWLSKSTGYNLYNYIYIYLYNLLFVFIVKTLCITYIFSRNHKTTHQSWIKPCFDVLSIPDLWVVCLLSLLLVTVCPCNVRGNCKMAAKQLEGMPTIQSAVSILLGTFAVIGKQDKSCLSTIKVYLKISGNVIYALL